MSGREAEVLRALGIEWKKGAQHISCPYPDHADQNPSWRWDERKARAFCTCITQRGGHAILEIVKRMEGIEFDAAKLRVAEILGRSDLIETKGQRMDAASLLQPPPGQRDDGLGSRYLGYRLGVPPDAVPMPTTRVVGWRELPYYDPPAGEAEQAAPGRPVPLRGVRDRGAGRAAACPSHLCRARTARARPSWGRCPRRATRPEEVGASEGRSERRRVCGAVGRSGDGATPPVAEGSRRPPPSRWRIGRRSKRAVSRSRRRCRRAASCTGRRLDDHGRSRPRRSLRGRRSRLPCRRAGSPCLRPRAP